MFGDFNRIPVLIALAIVVLFGLLSVFTAYGKDHVQWRVRRWSFYCLALLLIGSAGLGTGGSVSAVLRYVGILGTIVVASWSIAVWWRGSKAGSFGK